MPETRHLFPVCNPNSARRCDNLSTSIKIICSGVDSTLDWRKNQSNNRKKTSPSIAALFLLSVVLLCAMAIYRPECRK